MKRSTAICAFALLVVVAVWLLGANVFAFTWHGAHGFHREINGVRFYVPLLYREDDGSVYNEFSFYTYRSALFKKDGSITVSFQKQERGTPFGPMDPKSQQTLGVFLWRQRAVAFAEQPGNCFEYGINAVTLQPASAGPDRVWIECRFARDVRASFDGSANAIPDFYGFLGAAELLKQTH